MNRQLLAPLLIVGAMGLTGCATQIPPLNFSVPDIELSDVRLDAEVRSITVTLARSDEKVGEIDIHHAESSGTRVSTGADLTSVWHTALQAALDRTLIFRDDGATKVSLAVTVLKLATPDAGFEFVTEAVARYEIIDRSDGKIIFFEDIASTGTTPLDFAFLGAARARESVNRAVQNSIALFLKAARSIDLSKSVAALDR